jgi:uncharacterized secreted protein with C-terminal beta-propeller domain
MGRVGRTTVVLTTVALAVGGGVGLGAVFDTPAAQAADLPAFDSCTALHQWIAKARAEEARHPRAMFVDGTLGNQGTAATAGEVRAAVPQAAGAGGIAEKASAGSSAAGAVGSSATGTNVQEVGVDEPDQVKTNGHYLIGVNGDRTFWVATVANHTPHVIGRLKLDGPATQLLVSGNRALVFVQPNVETVRGLAGASPVEPGGLSSRLEIVELSDPSRPHMVAREDISGSIDTARQVGDVAWVVTESGSGVLPKRIVRNESGRVLTRGAALSCSDVRHPVKVAGSDVLTVEPVAINASAPFTSHKSVGVVASGGFVYASASRLYVATNTWGETASTSIHAFDISHADAARYVGSGSVHGQLLSQWAMSEQHGYLRVATTSGEVVPPKGEGDVPDRADRSATSVVVLAEKGKALVQVGRVGGLGRGERVWAVRYLGDLAAVVTFRQTDPLYLVDLSDPRHPRVAGDVELTGYSSYLHPVGDGLLLGVGREADSLGHVLDAKATLFDVHDPAHPKRVSNVDLGAGWSQVDGDTHAFTYLPDRHVALLPAAEDGVGAAAIQVDGATLRITGHLTAGGFVQRFVPVAADVVAFTQSALVAVDPVTLDALGATRLS